VSKSLKEVIRRFPDGLPLLDPSTDMKISSDEYSNALERKKTLQERLAAHSLSSSMTSEERESRVWSYSKKIELIESAKLLRQESLAAQNIVMRDELKKMKRVLRHLGYVDSNGVISTKGRTACEINTANELVVVELVFSGVFNDLTVEQSAALLSCLTFDERVKDDNGDPAKGLKSILSAPFFKLQEAARTVAKAQLSCNIELDEDEFVNQFNPGLMEAVYAWCKGMKFVEVQKLTGTFEGTTIRTLRRLEELIRQLSTAAKAIGNHELQLKFEKGGELIKRDIVFCSSLYL
jgi:ATP-dependent RNA helicase DOB1